ASISRRIWPLAIPPMAGLQDICAIFCKFIVANKVWHPIFAAAAAASLPACPPPTTITSYSCPNIPSIFTIVPRGTSPVFHLLFSAFPFYRLPIYLDIRNSAKARAPSHEATLRKREVHIFGRSPPPDPC